MRKDERDTGWVRLHKVEGISESGRGDTETRTPKDPDLQELGRRETE